MRFSTAPLIDGILVLNRTFLRECGRAARYLVVILIAFATLADTPVAAQALRIYHIDVEQADATLFVAPNGHKDLRTTMIYTHVLGKGLTVRSPLD